jgi:hypothetical protein
VLIKFESKDGPSVLMFDDIAVTLLKKMGMSGDVPGAVLAKDLPAVLTRLKGALSSEEDLDADDVATLPHDEPITERIRLATRAQPLVELLSIAEERGGDVMWDQYHASPLLAWP